jgi:exopolysaccharide biosynthesis polyprenyl glycosylphosphotransferase
MTEKKRESFRLNFVERRTLLVFGDLFVSVIALILSLIIWATISNEWLGLSLEFFQERVAFWFYLLPLVWIFLMVDMYNINQAFNWQNTIFKVSSSAGIGLLLYLVIYFASQSPLPRVSVAIFLVLSYSFTLIWRYGYIRIFSTQRFLQRVFIIGAGKAGGAFLKEFNDLEHKPFNIIGLIDDDPDKLNSKVDGFNVIANSDDLIQIVDSEKITDIIVAISGELKGSTFQTLLDVQHSGVQISRMPVVYEQLFDRVPINILEADWLLRSFIDQFQTNRFYIIGKRILDIIGGIGGIILLGLIYPFVGLAILIEDGRPILYSQVRLGARGEKFNIFKFRTMMKDAEANGVPILASEDDERATRVGRFLRRTHIDEIPQFWNVLRGDLSLVGPRSERPELVEHYLRRIPFYRARLLVKPGITGWAQVNYGYAGNIEETRIKLEYDLYYIKNQTIMLDILTIIKTPGMMLGMRGQ